MATETYLDFPVCTQQFDTYKNMYGQFMHLPVEEHTEGRSWWPAAGSLGSGDKSNQPPVVTPAK